MIQRQDYISITGKMWKVVVINQPFTVVNFTVGGDGFVVKNLGLIALIKRTGDL